VIQLLEYSVEVSQAISRFMRSIGEQNNSHSIISVLFIRELNQFREDENGYSSLKVGSFALQPPNAAASLKNVYWIQSQ
jgi:hypothetical protein